MVDHIPFLVDLNNQGSQLSPYFDIPMPQQFIVPGRREHLYIPGSNMADVHVYGQYSYSDLPGNVILIHIFNDSIYRECNLLFTLSKSALVLILCMHLTRHTSDYLMLHCFYGYHIGKEQHFELSECSR